MNPDRGSTLDAVDARLIDHLHDGFPVEDRPFARIGAALGLREEEVLERLGKLLSTGVLTRLGPLYQIERAGVVRQLFACSEPYFVESSFSTKRECVFGNIDAFRFAKLGKHHQIRARAAANIKNARATITDAATNVLDEPGNDLAAADVPPVRLLHAKENRIRMLHHLPRKSISNAFYVRHKLFSRSIAAPANTISSACIGST